MSPLRPKRQRLSGNLLFNLLTTIFPTNDRRRFNSCVSVMAPHIDVLARIPALFDICSVLCTDKCFIHDPFDNGWIFRDILRVSPSVAAASVRITMDYLTAIEQQFDSFATSRVTLPYSIDEYISSDESIITNFAEFLGMAITLNRRVHALAAAATTESGNRDIMSSTPIPCLRSYSPLAIYVFPSLSEFLSYCVSISTEVPIVGDMAGILCICPVILERGLSSRQIMTMFSQTKVVQAAGWKVHLCDTRNSTDPQHVLRSELDAIRAGGRIPTLFVHICLPFTFDTSEVPEGTIPSISSSYAPTSVTEVLHTAAMHIGVPTSVPISEYRSLAVYPDVIQYLNSHLATAYTRFVKNFNVELARAPTLVQATAEHFRGRTAYPTIDALAPLEVVLSRMREHSAVTTSFADFIGVGMRPPTSTASMLALVAIVSALSPINLVCVGDIFEENDDVPHFRRPNLSNDTRLSLLRHMKARGMDESVDLPNFVEQIRAVSLPSSMISIAVSICRGILQASDHISGENVAQPILVVASESLRPLETDDLVPVFVLNQTARILGVGVMPSDSNVTLDDVVSVIAHELNIQTKLLLEKGGTAKSMQALEKRISTLPKKEPVGLIESAAARKGIAMIGLASTVTAKYGLERMLEGIDAGGVASTLEETCEMEHVEKMTAEAA